MAETIHHWPSNLPAASTPFNLRPFSRSGGRSLGGISQNVRTDRGYWVGAYQNVIFRKGTIEQRRAWNALRVDLAGMVGLVAVPVCSTALLVSDQRNSFAPILTTHDDGTSFDDGTLYYEGGAVVEMAAFAPLGSTIVTLRKVAGVESVEGIRFSYQHALYETGSALSEPGDDLVQVPIFPAIRQPIPADAWLEVERPTCLCHLASDSEMDIEFPALGNPRPSVNFIEAVDYWNALALGLAA